MKIVALYRFDSEQERPIIEYEHEFTRRTGRTFDKLNTDTPEGADMARLYDITTYPAILAISDEGVMQQLWQGEPLPLISEVSYYNSGFNR